MLATHDEDPLERAFEDPLERVLELDSRSMKWGAIIGMCGALALHIVGATEAARLANGLGRWALDARSQVSAYLSHFYDIEMINPPPPPPPEEKPPEEEAPKPVAAIKAPSQEREAPPPAPAQAGKILTQEPDPNEPVDLTGQGFVTGNADAYAGGVTAKDGTSKTAVRNLNAVVGGVPGGTGTKLAPPSGPDQSRAPSIVGSSQWDCPFPPEADAEEINYQRVKLLIVVRPDGTPQDAKVLSDPGNGFGREARKCALTRRYEPALDREGRPVAGTISQVNITFQR
ncbi:MAG TPA: energy transducer TonB [Polyangiaceae bacterium]|nr:energy transducer TonB [Polyangiaceae bacterium]